MSSKYKATFPMTAQMSPISYVVTSSSMETKEEQALWYYNQSRDHDGLPPVKNLPKGTKFEEIYDF